MIIALGMKIAGTIFLIGGIIGIFVKIPQAEYLLFMLLGMVGIGCGQIILEIRKTMR